MELTIVGVSIAVFQSSIKDSNIPTCQCYSFFCDWADATESLSTEADDNGVLKNGYAINQEMELEYLMPQVRANFTFLPL